MTEEAELLRTIEVTITRDLPVRTAEQLRGWLDEWQEFKRQEPTRKDEEAELRSLKSKRHAFDLARSALVEAKAEHLKREADLSERIVELRIREAMIQHREESATERVEDMRTIVHAVFANNRYKYSRSLVGEAVLPGTPNEFGASTPSMTTPVSETETVEGER